MSWFGRWGVWGLLLLAQCQVVVGALLEPACLLDSAKPVRLLEDRSRVLDVEQIVALPEARFQVVEPGHFPVVFSQSAFWLRFALSAPSEIACQGWLSAGPPGLDEVHIYLRRDDVWELAEPIRAWSDRQPLLPLSLGAGERAEVVMRISSQGALRIEPQVADGLEQVSGEEPRGLVEGLLLGLAGVLVPFSLIVSLQIRSQLLLLSALGGLAGGALASIADGYLLYWPVLVPWKPVLSSLLGALTHFLFAGYLITLFRAARMPPAWRLGLCFAALLPAAMMLAGLWLDYVPVRQVAEAFHWIYWLLVPVFALTAWRLGLRLDWLAWSVAGLFVGHGLASLALDVSVLDWPFSADRIGLVAVLPGIFMLVMTLIREFYRSRRRERFALARLEGQQEAERERLERTVATRTEQLRHSLRTRSALLARISHDLRSPLAGIVDCARLLKQEAPGELPEYIERSAWRQLDRIDDLLEFSRVELQQQELVLAPGYLFGFLKDLEEQASILFHREDCQLTCRFDGDLPPIVHADFRRLGRVLINLLETAAQGQHGGCLQLFVGLAADFCSGDDVVLMFVIAPQSCAEDRERPQQPGASADDVGLAGVRQWLRQMGSELVAEQGMRFSFRLQLTTADEEELDLLLDDSTGTPIQGDGLRILVVDDVLGNREGMSDLLGGYGFDVWVAQEGAEALHLLARESFDLLITDQTMPGLDGWALLAVVRDQYPDLPVLLYSAAPASAPAGSPHGLGFDATLLKPAEGGVLLGMVARLIGAPVAGQGA
ncbi:response regulator [Pseudomonas sp. KB-10]|uniref:hybrid sensor histidine kinase/response regulator n=1 Tax=Pseudomonas sp. KB-10 TaxID=2292264 RepID=UPI001BAF5737|nr:response regulator [Pseudomonas sp. KB-10]